MDTVSDEMLREIEARAQQLRICALQMIWDAGSGHCGPSLSWAEIAATLYTAVLNVRPAEPKWPDRDRFVLSKGHGAPTLYAVLAQSGFYPPELLHTFRRINGSLQGHPDVKATPGLEATTGSLGNGLSVGAGMALATRYNGHQYRVYVLLGDGECQEGQVWEAAMAASTRKLGNLIAIVDRNGLQQSGSTEDRAAIEPLDQKWLACGWRVRTVDGHNAAQLLDAFKWAQGCSDQPTAIIARTTKGKGVSFMEGRAEWHAKAMTAADMEQAMTELRNGRTA